MQYPSPGVTIQFPNRKRRGTHGKELNTINEKLQDVLSLLIILENDFQSQHTDEVYQRTIHIIHEILKSALNDLKKPMQTHNGIG